MAVQLERLFLTPEEVAATLGCSAKHIRDRCRAGDPLLAAEQWTAGGRWHIPRNCAALQAKGAPTHEDLTPKPNPAVRELRRLAMELLTKIAELED